ncbi:secretoglobin family 1D member-like [Mustela putorius furo]|uniref:Secretoglobin family 1D member-like n=1 Tax=Mustela putorius furo TaxID=9669 RepID=M3YRE6_MUSPF|nr:secretoglobin family 1D member-like [Mustela putorius furo]
MRLSLSVLLVTLALYSYEANATVCLDFVNVSKGFLFQDAASFKTTIQGKFNPPQGVIEDYLEVKKCTDQISAGNRKRLGEALGKIVLSCT